MSHISKMKLHVLDLRCLSAACKRLGVELVEGQTSYRAWVRDTACLHAIRIPGDSVSSEIGVIAHASGKGFALEYDFFGSRGKNIASQVGNNGSKLMQAYAVERAKKEAFLLGHQVIEQPQANGHIRLLVQAGR